MTEKDKKLRNKLEFILLFFYAIGIVMVSITKSLLSLLIVLLSVPFCMIKPIKKWLEK